MEWVTRLQEISDSRAWPQRNYELWFPFEYDNYDISSNRYYLLSSGLCESQYAGAFQLRRERERWGGEGERRDGRIEREVCVYVVLKCFTTVASATVPRNVTIYNGENVSLSTS